MTSYTVHLDREVRLVFEGIDADSPEEAAEIACDRHPAAADDTDSCDGEIFTAQVDADGDDDDARSRSIDFEPERLRKAAPKLLEALTLAQRALNTAPRFRVGDTDSYKIAAIVDRTIAEATARPDGGRP